MIHKSCHRPTVQNGCMFGIDATIVDSNAISVYISYACSQGR